MRKGLIVIAVLFWAALVLPAADSTERLLGDESDGSRAHPTHFIKLFPGEIDPNSYESIKGEKINPDINESSKVLLPFSTKWTCGECHSYNSISKGWHFNAAEPNVPCGRPGQPWIYFDSRTGTQIPLSYRPWPGTFKPEQVGLTDRKFTLIFGRQMPGGGVGERDAEDTQQRMRQYISGKLEINCLACHNADPGQDQGGTTGYAVQIARGNFRWAAAAACGFASVTGCAEDMPDTYDPFEPFEVESAKKGQKPPPIITYHKAAFDQENRVLFNIVREVPAERCYFCHSNVYLGGTGKTEEWSSDKDVHLAAGLTCVDCHRNGIDHNIIRGYEEEDWISGNTIAAAFTCQGCHLGEKSSVPLAGRLGAPVPKHPGIPPIHFEKLACTACHSEPWPGKETILTKTSRAHRLGTPNVNKSKEVLPHIISPVLAKVEGGKISPYKLLWPAFWGILKDKDVSPIDLETVRQSVGKILVKEKLPDSGDWPALTDEQISEGLKALQKSIKEKVVYVSGGKLHYLEDEGKLFATEYSAAKPYLWPIAHDVRPAAQSLGVNGCGDCHSTDAPFFFGAVTVDSPIVAERQTSYEMIEFQGVNRRYAWLFAFTFVFRPWLKIIVIGCSGLLAGVLLLYALRALACVVKVLAGKSLE